MKKVELDYEDAVATYDDDGDGRLGKDELVDLNMSRLWFLFDLDDDDRLDETEWRYLIARGTAENGLYAIRLGGRGDLTDSNVLWRHDRSLPNIPSPLLYQGILYVLKEGGVFTALDPETGEPIKVGRVEEGAYFASPVAAGGVILAATQDGRVALIDAGRDWSVLTVGEFEEEIWATPAISRDQVFVRTQAALYCFQPES